jgi:hypothetical protein
MLLTEKYQKFLCQPFSTRVPQEIILWLYSPLLGLGRFFSFLILYTVVRTPWMGHQPVTWPLHTHRTTQNTE